VYCKGENYDLLHVDFKEIDRMGKKSRLWTKGKKIELDL